MEDLGNINITIRESGGGGGGGFIPGMGGGGGGQPGSGPGPVAALSGRTSGLFDKLQRVLGVTGELGSAIRSPSVAGFVGIGSSSSATAGALAGLTGAAALAFPAVIAVTGAIMAAKAALDVLSRASEYVADRIRELTRFSGSLMVATAQERLAQFQRQLADATVNGKAYAQVQVLETQANNAQAQAMLHLNAVIADMAALFQRLRLAFWQTVTPIISVLSTVNWRRVLEIANLFNPLYQVLRLTTATIQNLLQSLASVFQWLGSLPFIGSLSGVQSLAAFGQYLQQVLQWLQGIWQNTQPQQQRVGNVNAWFMDDVRAVTGRRY